MNEWMLACVDVDLLVWAGLKRPATMQNLLFKGPFDWEDKIHLTEKDTGSEGGEMATKGGAAAAHPSAARISDSPCYHQYSASLKCESRSRLNHVTEDCNSFSPNYSTWILLISSHLFEYSMVCWGVPLIRFQIHDLDYLITWDKFHNETLRSWRVWIRQE